MGKRHWRPGRCRQVLDLSIAEGARHWVGDQSFAYQRGGVGGGVRGGVWHKASVSGRLPLAAPIGLGPN